MAQQTTWASATSAAARAPSLSPTSFARASSSASLSEPAIRRASEAELGPPRQTLSKGARGNQDRQLRPRSLCGEGSGELAASFERDQRSCVEDTILPTPSSSSFRAHSFASSLIGPCSASDNRTASRNACDLPRALTASSTAADTLGAYAGLDVFPRYLRYLRLHRDRDPLLHTGHHTPRGLARYGNLKVPGARVARGM